LKAVVGANLLQLSYQAVPGGPTFRSGLGPSFLRIAECRALVLQSLCENPTLSRSQKRPTDTSSQGSLWSMPRSSGDSIVWRQRWQWLSG
jgi:hypothetical protein